MEKSSEILSDLTVHMKYSRFLKEESRRESWNEIVSRNEEMHLRKHPLLEREIRSAFNLVRDKKVLPSMRSMQFGGKPIEIANNRIYNCAYMPIDDTTAFSESMFLLLGGTGVGYSVQKHHVKDMSPIVPKVGKNITYTIPDSIEGWSYAVQELIDSYFLNGCDITFDYGEIRPKGSPIKTSGGRAPGPLPLKHCIESVNNILKELPEGHKLTPLQAHDIMCYIAEAVLSGGIRRAAMISLFSADDKEMLTAKVGNWWETNPQRARANNSIVLRRDKVSKGFFENLWETVRESGCGEPGFYFTNNKDWGTNPCCEIALKPFQFCNLTEINVSNLEDKKDFHERVRAATIIATLQASYTRFHLLRNVWEETTKAEALIGVSMTGIASNKVFDYDLEEASSLVKEINEEFAKQIGINPAARTTCVKPAGTTSLTLGTSSGIHAWHNDYYIRRIRVNKTEPIYRYLKDNHEAMIEDESFNPQDMAVISIPQKSPEGAILRNESPMELLRRIKTVSNKWVKGGHVDGDNTHNVSATISLKEDEWEQVGQWMWHNRDCYNGLSVLPYNGGTYVQSPFEDCSKDTYENMMKTLNQLDLSKVTEHEDITNLGGEIACAGGVCEIDISYPTLETEQEGTTANGTPYVVEN